MRPAPRTSAGVPLKVLSERLGHASVNFTADTYQHALEHMQDPRVALGHWLRVVKPVLDNRRSQLRALRDFEVDDSVAPTQGILDR